LEEDYESHKLTEEWSIFSWIIIKVIIIFSWKMIMNHTNWQKEEELIIIFLGIINNNYIFLKDDYESHNWQKEEEVIIYISWKKIMNHTNWQKNEVYIIFSWNYK